MLWKKEFNADPNRLKEAVINPERAITLALGEAFELKKSKKQEKNRSCNRSNC